MSFSRATIAQQAAIGLLASLILTFEYWAFGPDSAMYGYGTSLETVPTWLGLLKTNSTFSFWTPIVAGGVDRLSFWANADPFNVATLLFSMLPTWIAAGLYLVLQRFIPMFFVIRVVEEQLGLKGLAPIAAGLLYGALTYPAAGYMLAEPSVPLAIWALPYFAGSWRRLFWAFPAGLLVSTMTGFIWAMPILPCFMAAWFFLVRQSYSLRLWAALCIFSVGLFVADLPQLLALLANVAVSQRAEWPVETIDLSPTGLFYLQTHYDLFNQDHLLKWVTIAIPLVALLLGVPAAVWRRHKDREARIFLLLAALYALISLKVLLVGVQDIFAHWLPWVRGVSMGRFYAVPAPFLIPILVTISGMLTLRQLADQAKSEKMVRYLAVALFSLMFLFLVVRPKDFLFMDLLIDGWNQRHYEVAALELIKARETDPFRVASVLPLQPAYAYGQGLEAADGWTNLFPARYRELWLKLIAPGMKQLAGMKQVLDPDQGRPQDNYIFLNLDLITPGIAKLEGEDPVVALHEGFDMSRRINLDLLSLLNVKYLLSSYRLKGPGLVLRYAPDPEPNEVRSRDYATGLDNFSNPLAPRDPLVHPLAAWSALREALARRKKGKRIYIYENVRVLPRFRLVRQLEVLPDKASALDRLASADVNELARIVVVEATDLPTNDVLRQPQTFVTGTVTPRRYTPDRIDLDVATDGLGFLVVANTWNRYWRAEVDGALTPLLPVNHAQTGLRLPAGARHVTLRYLPPYHWLPFLGSDSGS
jgi:hypothetical protein